MQLFKMCMPLRSLHIFNKTSYKKTLALYFIFFNINLWAEIVRQRLKCRNWPKSRTNFFRFCCVYVGGGGCYFASDHWPNWKTLAFSAEMKLTTMSLQLSKTTMSLHRWDHITLFRAPFVCFIDLFLAFISTCILILVSVYWLRPSTR